jgi:hypothetical protein
MQCEKNKQKCTREQRRQSEDNVPLSVERDLDNALGKSEPIYQRSDPEVAVSTEINFGDEFLPLLSQIPLTELVDRQAQPQRSISSYDLDQEQE